MTRLLRLIPQYRALEAEIAQAGAARILAESEVREWKARCQVAEQKCDAAQAEHNRSVKQLCNFQALMAGAHIVPYPDVYLPPQREEPRSDGELSTPPMRRQAREIQAELNQKARTKAIEDFNRLKNPPEQPQADQEVA